MAGEIRSAPKMPEEVATVFDAMPAAVASRLVEIREVLFCVASELPETGGLREYLAWGQPSYRAMREGIGTSVRLAAHSSGRPAMYVHCGTSLISEYRAIVGHLRFDGKRAVLMPVTGPLPAAEVRIMAELALTMKRKRHR